MYTQPKEKRTQGTGLLLESSSWKDVIEILRLKTKDLDIEANSNTSSNMGFNKDGDLDN